MLQSLTPRQNGYFQYISEYIWRNESAPRLEEIADYFGVKTPTAHKALVALRDKGLLYFGRDRVTGFYIRIPERFGTPELVFDINIIGKVNRYGEIHDFPKKIGHFPVIIPGADPLSIFAVELRQHIIAADMQAGDLLIFVSNKRPVPGDIGIMRYGKSWLLVNLYPVEQNPTQPFYILTKESSPEALQAFAEAGYLFWWPLAFHEATEAYFAKAAIQYQVPWRPVAPEDILATAIRLERPMTI
jgi:hypothetical protein